MIMRSEKLIVITGPTASGKTGLAIQLAGRYSGEIICADSRTIYRGMDIGTAKPTITEQTKVPHHLLDVTEPGQRYTAADFQLDAYEAMADIVSRGRIPFLVGGTGLYIDSVVREYSWPEQAEGAEDRDKLEKLSVETLHMMIKEQRKDLPLNSLNKRHLINTLVRHESGKARSSPRESVTVVAITMDKVTLETRIRERAEEMFEQGVIEEAKRLADKYGWENESMTSNIYPIIRRLVDGEITQQQAIDLFVTKDKQLAKRQITWLKRFNYVRWLSLDDARAHIETTLG